MAKTSEPELGLAVLQVLAATPTHRANIQTLIQEVPKYVNLTAEDREPSQTREGEEMWEQRVRNLKSHDKADGNILALGYASHPKRDTYEITQNGLDYLRRRGFI